MLSEHQKLGVSGLEPQIQNPESQVTIEYSFLPLAAENIKKLCLERHLSIAETTMLRLHCQCLLFGRSCHYTEPHRC